MEVIVYSDFNCPFCYVLNERIHAAGVADRVQWRGVQHAPQLQIPMVPGDACLSAELQEEVRAIRQWAPEITIAVPSGKPNTGPANAAVAAALLANASAAHDFKDSLYRTFWRQGTDLSDSKVLRDLARAAGLPERWVAPGILPPATLVRPCTSDAADVAATVAGWQDSWVRSGFRGVPALLRSDGRRLEGLVAQQVLQVFVQG